MQDKLIAAQRGKKKYADHKVRYIEFQTGDNDLYKVPPMKEVMRFFKKGNLSLRYIGLFEIIECVRLVVYRLD